MSNKAAGGVSRRGALIALAALAAVAVAGAAWLSMRSASESGRLEETRARLVDDASLADEYRAGAVQATAVSANDNDARSTDFIEAALKKAGISGSNNTYGDPENVPGTGFRKLTNEISANPVRLSSILAFMSEVERGKKNLALQDAKIWRAPHDARDAWQVTLHYSAVVRAK